MRLYNSPTQAFFEEIFQEMPHGRVPTEFIFQMYCNYCDKNKEKPLDRRLFEDALAAWVSEHSDVFGFVRKRGRLRGFERIWLASHPWGALEDYGTDKKGVPIECCNTHIPFDNFAMRHSFATWSAHWNLTDRRFSAFVICYPMLDLMEKSEKEGRTPWYDGYVEGIWNSLLTDYTDPNKKNYKIHESYTEKDVYRADIATGAEA